jgi:hypothetical protein
MKRPSPLSPYFVACTVLVLMNFGMTMPKGYALSQSIVGSWHGTKGENDPTNGSALTLNFTFTFGSDGSYTENAYFGGSKAMSANGSYQQNGNQLSFSPNECKFPTGLENKVKLFPIPNDTTMTYATSFSPWGSQSQISLKDAGSNDQWGLKPGMQESRNLFGSSPAISAKAASFHESSRGNPDLRVSVAERDRSPRLVPAIFAQTHAPSRPSTLTATASPEEIFRRLSNDTEKQFYRESTPAQRRLVLEHFTERYRRMRAGKPYMYDDFDENISTEAMFKALAYLELLDVYNLAEPNIQCIMSSYGYPRWIEFEMGIKLSLEQEDRAARSRGGCRRLDGPMTRPD